MTMEVKIGEFTFYIDESVGSAADHLKMYQALEEAALAPQAQSLFSGDGMDHDISDYRIKVQASSDTGEIDGPAAVVLDNGVLPDAGDADGDYRVSEGTLKFNPSLIDKSQYYSPEDDQWHEAGLFDVLFNELGNLAGTVNKNVEIPGGPGSDPNTVFGWPFGATADPDTPDGTEWYTNDGSGNFSSNNAGPLEQFSAETQDEALNALGLPPRQTEYDPGSGRSDNGTFRVNDPIDPEYDPGNPWDIKTGSDPGNRDVSLSTLDAAEVLKFMHLNAAAERIEEIADAVLDTLALFFAALLRGSPLVLDLDDSGTIELNSLANSQTYWDIDEDGFAEHSGWVTGGDGLLALDVNDNGRIDDNGELFGTVSTDGFTILATYDSNADGLITSEDAIWNDLLVWVDANENGYSESAELYSMDDLDIISFDLNATEVSQTNQGHDVTHTSTFTVDTGGGTDARIVHDVWFQYDHANTVYVGDYSIDFDALALHDLRGYGKLPDLYIAMSIDNDDQDPDSLISLVDDLAGTAIADLFDETADTLDAVKAIMFRWAGVDGLTGDERGGLVDSRELGFLEALSGQPFLQRGIYSNPVGYEAQYDLQEGFANALNHVYARLTAQGAGGALFTGNWFYNNTSDSFSGITGLDTAVLDALETAATGLANTGERQTFWENVVRMVESAVGTDNLDGGSLAALQDAIFDSDNSLDLEDDILPALPFDRPMGVDESGTSGNDTMNGSSSDDTLTAAAGTDTLNGLAGNDWLKGGTGTDTLTGGAGGDYLWGEQDNDTYVYNLGDGDDIFKESTGTDTISFGAGIDSGDLTISRNLTDLVIDIDTGSATARLIIEDQFSATSGNIETLLFNDTSTIDLTALSYTLTGTSGNDILRGAHGGDESSGSDTIYGGDGNDTIYGEAPSETDNQANTLYGEAGNDTIYGAEGVDTIYGGDGNDTITANGGNDDLTGGAGDDIVKGNAGNDTYRYVSGKDVYTDSSGTDELRLDAVWNGVTPQYFRIGNDLQIYFSASDNITIKGHFSGSQIESMIYANSTSVNLTIVSAITQGTSGNDSLSGTSGTDILYGFDGNDTLSGGNGNDSLYGGNGNDTLNGQNNDDYLDGGAGDDDMNGSSGNDHYFYTSGHDIAEEGGGTDILELVAGWTWADLSFARYDASANDLVIQINGANSITIENMFASSNQVETLRLNDGTGDVNLVAMHYTTYGTSGNDSITGVTNSNFSGGAMNDTIYGLGGTDSIDGGNGNDTLYGGDGTDTLDGDNNDDTLYGEGGNDTLNGQNSNDTMDGGAGDDTLNGSTGNDTYIYGAGLDSAADTGGTDTLWINGGVTVNDISFSNVSTYNTKITVTASVDELTVVNLRNGSTSLHIETIKFDDGFSANLPSYQGWLNGTSGNDSSTGNGSANTMIGYAGNDTMDGLGGDDAIHGGSGTDSIEGGDGADLLHGGTGDDSLYGENGLDTLYGGAGVDTFVLQSASAFNNVDVMKDYSIAQSDKLDINDIVDFDPMNDEIGDFLTLTNSGSNTQVFVDRDGTGGTYSSVQVALLEGVTNLDAEDMLAGGYLIAA